jgi:uncharacterized repeat protein (TIGR01451 family)
MKHFIKYKKSLPLLLALLLVMADSAILSKGYSWKAILPAATTSADANLTDQPMKKSLSDSGQPPTALDADSQAAARAAEAYGKLPLSFEVNRGQADAAVKFMARGGNAALLLTADGALLTLAKPCAARRKPTSRPSAARAQKMQVAAVQMKMLGSNSGAQVEGLEPLQGSTNYLMGKDPQNWHTGVPLYGKVRYRDLYPGVNLIYYGNRRQLEYDFEIAPGGDPNLIKIAFAGAQKILLDEEGNLRLRTRAGDIQMRKPAVYQEREGIRQAVACRYVLKGRNRVGFAVDDYDARATLVIDPIFSYSTFLGGSSDDRARAIALDASGNAYIAGTTSSFNFPVTLDAYSTTYNNSLDLFVTKLNAAGSGLIYSTYIGGNGFDSPNGIAIDASGNAYVTGYTNSSNYPTTPGAYQTVLASSFDEDAFVTKLNPAGDGLVYSTYLGGNSDEQSNGIAIGVDGSAYVAGTTESANFPTTAGAYKTTINSYAYDAFVTRLNPAGSALIYSTFLGGTNDDQAYGIQVDTAGNAFVTGQTVSANFPTTAGAYQTAYGDPPQFASGDAFVTKLNDTGTGLVYSTYLGGSSQDTGSAIALAASGEAYITGSTTSSNFPTTPGVVRVINGGAAKSTNSGTIWLAKNAGLTNSTVLSLAIDPVTPTTLLAGTSGGGAFRSTDGGAIWSVVNSGLTDLTIKTLAIDATAPSTIYLGTQTRGVFRSTNGGSTWRAINTGQNGMNVSSLKIDPTNHAKIYAGTDQGVYQSTNGGANWVASNNGLTQGLSINVLAIDPTTPTTLYVGLNFNGIYKSTNGGTNWSQGGLQGVAILSLAFDPATSSTIYAGTSNGLYKSTDAGANWRGINTGLTNRTVNAIAISPANPSILYAGTANDVYKSTDAGNVWDAVGTGLAGAVVNALVIDPFNSQTLYSGTAGGNADVFVTRLNAAGTALGFSTLLGGSAFDNGYAITLDGPGNIYVTGTTNSVNFPVTRGMYRNFTNGFSNGDAFVSKLNPAGAALIYSTYLGGFDFDSGAGIAVDGAGNAYVAGYTSSREFPVTDNAYQLLLGNSQNSFSSDGFVSKLLAMPGLIADLKVEITTQQSSVLAGGFVSYTMTVTNNGPDSASNVLVSDDLPSSLSYNFCSSSNSCSRAGNGATFLVGTLGAGQSVTLNLGASVACSIPASISITNAINVDASSIDPEPGNNTASATISATNPPMTLSPPSATFGNGGGNATVNVISSTNCSWTATSNAPWITIVFSSGCCNGGVNYNVEANVGPARTGTMTVAGQTFTVFQDSGCTYGAGPTNQNFTADGGPGSVTVTASDGACPWTAASNDNWINITSGSNGSGNGTVNFSVTANTLPNGSTSPRTGSLTVAGQIITINQSGLSCGFTLGSTSQTFNAGGGPGSVTVTTSNGSCPWTATSNAPWLTVTSGPGATGNGTVTFTVSPNNGSIRVGSITIAGQNFGVTQAAGTAKKLFDFDADGKADLAIWRSATGVWLINNSANGSTSSLLWGVSTDVLVPADFDGDGKTDKAVWRPSAGQWFIRNSSDGTVSSASWGISADVPVPADYDGDGKADLAVWRPSNGTWYINGSSGAVIIVGWGVSTDVPVPADYDGDGKTDIAIWRPATGQWWIINSSNGAVSSPGWGVNGDKPVPADYDGDGKADIAIWRPSTGTWYIINSSTGSSSTVWGMSTDKPVPADYDGDGKTDIAIWRPSTGQWWMIKSSTGGINAPVWGVNGDSPIPAAFIK